MPYTKHHGDPLTTGEVAHLLTRAAQGEALPAVPVRNGCAWHLAHVRTLTPTQRADHARRVASVAALLHHLTAAPLSA